MRALLMAWFAFVLVAMGWVTVSAGLDRGVTEALVELWPDRWFRATLADAYFAFLAVYLWVAYRETTWTSRILWLAGFLLLGNFAIAAYALRALVKHPKQRPLEQALLRPQE